MKSSSSQSKKAEDTLASKSRQSAHKKPDRENKETDIAIIGMACRFPGAADYHQFWQNLVSGVDSVTEIPPDRWDWRAYWGDPLTEPNKTNSRWGGFIDDVDKFDASFFNISPREAELMDPQQRILLELSFACIEDAGYRPSALSGSKTGVFTGSCNYDYKELQERYGSQIEGHLLTGTANTIVPNRLSYHFNLHGPSVSVDTACSSSLVALHQAVQAMEHDECQLCLVGGINILVSPERYIPFSKLNMLSPTGRCRTFDRQADGYVRGEGAGVILLKRLDQALADGDQIYGIIKGSAVNHGGQARTLTSPNAFAQSQVIVEACQRAGVLPTTINYIETHGTGTPLGDPIEIHSLKRAVGKLCKELEQEPQVGYCGLGAVKTNIGHLEAAAGMAGMIKVLLAMKHKKLPGINHFSDLNPRIKLADSPFYLVEESKNWEAVTNETGKVWPRRAGVSSFGFGGTNAHIVVEEAPANAEGKMLNDEFLPIHHSSFIVPHYLVVLSAKNEERLREYVVRLLAYLEANSDILLTEVAYTLQVGREAMDSRLALVVEDIATLCEKLTAYLSGEGASTAKDIEYLYWGHAKKEQEKVSVFAQDEDLQEAVNKWIIKGKLGKLAELWVSGVEIEWALLYGQHPPHRISLPTYPFARKRYWLDGHLAEKTEQQSASGLTLPKAYPSHSTISPITGQQKVVLADLNAQSTSQNEGGKQAPPVSMTLYDPIEEADRLATKLAITAEKTSVDLTTKSISPDRAVIEYQLRQQLVEILYLDADDVEAHKKFIDLGLDSITGVEWVKRINDDFDLNISATKLYDYPTLQGLAGYLAEIMPVEKEQEIQPDALDNRSPILLKQPGGQDETEALGEIKEYGLVVSTGQAVTETRLESWQVPTPNDDEIQIEVKASAINFPDLLCLKGLYPTLPSYPFVPGFEVAGIVTVVGSTVRNIAVGDEVMALTGQQLGGHARYVNVPSLSVVKKPGNLSFEEASSLPIIFLTVYHAFELANLKEGEHILIQTAAGGCGLMAVQLANLHQATIYGTSSRDYKLSFLKQIGVDYRLNYTQDFEADIRNLTDLRGVDVVLNMLGGTAIQKGLNVLAPGGRYLELAVHGLKVSPNLDLSRLVHNQAFYSIDGRRAGFSDASLLPGYLNRMVDMVEKEEICPVIHRIYPLSRIQEALEYVESGAHIGKVVISHTQEEVIDLTEKCLNDLIQQKQRSRRRKAVQPHLAKKRVLGSHPANDDIAIIGMSGRFPGANDVDEFWQNIATGVDSITEVSPERWDVKQYYDPNRQTPGKSYSKWAGLLADIDQFDPLFFNISPREAELMDPQQRLFLEEAWKVIEDAGYSPKALAGRNCGVFVGAGMGDYAHQMMPNFTGHSLTGNALSILASRIAYFLDLAGPCITIDTACSSSLSAIHVACQSLLNDDCDLALAGGVHIMTTPSLQMMTSQMGILSPSGQCRTFDASADGWVMSEGVGVVVLKPVSQAIEDRDHIYGIIKSSGFNQNGRSNGLTAPKSLAQSQLQQKVYQKGGVNPETIDYVEVQGVSSSLGDAIEVDALKDSFAAFTTEQNFCALGSLKPNIGHPLTASGIACLIKVLLSLKHQQLPPTIHLEKINDAFELEQSPFYINTALKGWTKRAGTPRRAAINGFGISGTNCHLVVEEYSQPESGGDRQPSEEGQPHLIVLSARNEKRLRAYAQKMLDFMEEGQAISLAELAYTLQVGREAMDSRLAFVARDQDDLRQGVKAFLENGDDENESMTLFRDSSEQSRKEVKILASGQVGQDIINRSFSEKDWEKLAVLWAKGVDIPWEQLYGSAQPHRLSLPTYPFARERYWLPEVEAETSQESSPKTKQSPQPRSEYAQSQGVLNPTEGNEHQHRGEQPALPSPSFLSRLAAIPADERASYLQKYLQSAIAKITKLKPVQIIPEQPLISLGLDSLMMVELINTLRRELRFNVPKDQLDPELTLAQLVRHILPYLEHTPEDIAGESAGTMTSSLPTDLPLVPSQQWFFEGNYTNPHHWNAPVLLETPPDLDVFALQEAIHYLFTHHEALCLRVTTGESGFRQQINPPDQFLPFNQVDLSLVPKAEQAAAIQARAEALQAGLDFSQGPLIRFTYFDLGPQQAGRLFIVAHHLATDAFGLYILLTDLAQAYQQRSRGQAISLLPPVTSYTSWVQQLVAYAQSGRCRQHLPFWLETIQQPVQSLPLDFPEGFNDDCNPTQLAFPLSAQETQQLTQQLTKAADVQVPDILLSAILEAYCDWADADSLWFETQGHGRDMLIEGVDVSQSVCWANTIYPFYLKLEQTLGPIERLVSVRDQLRRLPNQGLDYGILRYLSQEAKIKAQMQTHPDTEVKFLYHSNLLDITATSLDMFQPALETVGRGYGPGNEAKHRLYIYGHLLNGQLRLDLVFSENLFKKSTMERLGERVLAALHELALATPSSSTPSAESDLKNDK